jgi:hypothetical protein
MHGTSRKDFRHRACFLRDGPEPEKCSNGKETDIANPAHSLRAREAQPKGEQA